MGGDVPAGAALDQAMIWTDPATGRRWNVEQLGRIDLSFAGGVSVPRTRWRS